MARTYRFPSWMLAGVLVACTGVLLSGRPSQASSPPPAAPKPASRADAFTDMLAAQIALDNAGISPGLVDGRGGQNTRLALSIYQRARGLPPNGTLDVATRRALGLGTKPPLDMYTITDVDAAGPFEPDIPTDLEEKGKLPALAYKSMLEMLSERFHTTPATLTRLNAKARFLPGDTVRVPAVVAMDVPATGRRKGPGADADRVQFVSVSTTPSQLVVIDNDGRLLFSAPVTSGSEHDPLPPGNWKVRDVYLLPVFHYNPALFWDADPSHARTVIQPGPNNPVGVIWIDLDREHYGLHGTPEPQAVGRSASHGCVRLTNWDALRLAAYVTPGTRVVFDEATPDFKPWPALGS